MATRCNIAYKDKQNGKYIYSYCHYDGYFDGVGIKLLRKYFNYNDVKNLIDKGNMEGIGKYYDEKEGKPKITSNIEDLKKFDYYYIFTRNRWIAAKYDEKPQSLKLILENIDDSYMIKDKIKEQLEISQESINMEIM